MISKIKTSSIARTIEILYPKLYTGILLIILIIYLYMGVWPFYKVTQEKRETIKELTTVNNMLRDKKTLLQNVSDELVDTKVFLESLRRVLPNTVFLQKYLVDMYETSARAGFRQERLNIGQVYETAADVSGRFSGSPLDFQNLIKEIEQMPRLTSVEVFSVSLKEEQAYMNMQLKIYYLGDK